MINRILQNCMKNDLVDFLIRISNQKFNKSRLLSDATSASGLALQRYQNYPNQCQEHHFDHPFRSLSENSVLDGVVACTKSSPKSLLPLSFHCKIYLLEWISPSPEVS